MSGRSAKAPSKNLSDWADRRAPEGYAPVLSRGELEAYMHAGIPLKGQVSDHLEAYVPVLYSTFRIFIMVLQRRVRNREYLPHFYRYRHFGQWRRWFEKRSLGEMLRHFYRHQKGERLNGDDYQNLFAYFAEYCLNDETIPGPPLSPDDPIFK